MKKILRKPGLIFSLLFFPLSLLPARELSLADYLNGWLENDRDIKNAALNLQKAQLSAENAAITNGFDINLSTGTMRLTLNGDKTSFTLSPQVEAKLSEVRNLSLSAGTDISISSDSKISNASLKAAIDILDTNKEKRQLSERKTLRSVLESKRNLENRIQTAEKSFYQNVKSLLKAHSSIISSQTSLYSDTVSFEKIKAQGYASTSSTYRLAEMKVRNAQHSIETSQRSLNHDYEIFLLKCSINPDKKGKSLDTSFDEFLSIVSESFENLKIKNIEDYKKENYKDIEKALWDQEINSLSRNAEKNYALKGSAGYTFNNTNTKDGSGKNSDSVDAGLSSYVLGMNINAGVSIPVNPAASPAFTAGISFNPNTLKKQKLTAKENIISEQGDVLSLETALHNYSITLADKKQSLEDLLWEKNSIEENLAMYTQTEKDMKKYLDYGIINQSEYLSAKTNKQKYESESLVNKLDMIIYNCEIESLFYGDN